jgi:tetratricopeptide (TPR) repeat protein
MNRSDGSNALRRVGRDRRLRIIQWWLRERNSTATWIAVALAAGGVGWIAVAWWRADGDLADQWLDTGDRIASMMSAFLAVVGVVLAYLAWRAPHRAGEREAMPALVSQAGAVISDAGPATGGPPRQLPREATWFTGRTAELERLLAMMSDPQEASPVVISAIDGMAGVGKTTLAVYAAHRMRDRFPDGQLFINLHGFTETVPPVGPAEALDRLLRMLGIPGEQIPGELDDRAALWRSTLAGRRMLIVLDDAATEAQVAPLLPGEPGCLVLVTSRRRLAGLEATHAISLDTLPTDDAVALFAATAGQPQWAAEPDNRALLVEAVQLCGRLPLAIRIAAARLQGRPASAVAELVAQLRDEELRLATLADPADGGRNVTAALELSYQRLSAGPQRIYRLLGLHPGSEFDAYAAAALAQSTLAESRRWLDRLVGAHLLQEPAPGRYGFHDLVRAHAATLAGAEPDQQVALDRLLNHYRHTTAVAMDIAYPYAREQRPQLPSVDTVTLDLRDPAAALGWLDTELPNLLAVARYATEHGRPEHVWHLSTILHRHLYTRGHYHDAETLHRQALTTARATSHQAGEQAGELEALNDLGHIHRLQGRYEQATQRHQQALRIARAAGYRPGELNALHGLGFVHLLQGRYEQAADHFGQALRIARATGHRPGELNALHGLGQIHWLQGRYEQAADHFGQALRIARATGHRPGELAALNGLGQIHWYQGRYEQAADHLGQALRIARATGNRTGELNALNGLGQVYQRQGQYEQATDHYQQVLRIARATGHRHGELNALNGLG